MMGNVKLGLIALLAILAGYGLWWIYHSGYSAGQAEVQVRWDNAEHTVLTYYFDQWNKAKEQHDKDQALIDDYRARLNRMRAHFPLCGSAESNSDQDRAARALSERADQLFGRLQERIGGIVSRCDQLNADAIRMNNELGLGGTK
jgi:hypothetical protein